MNPDDTQQTRTTEWVGPPQDAKAWSEEKLPEFIGPYRILEVLARSMAIVYKAEQQNPKRIVALKIPRGGALLRDDERRRFLREVAHGASIDHAGIVPVLDAGEHDGLPYYTMPLISGRNLREHLRAEQVDQVERLRLFREVCKVVDALHEKDLVHRDLKPENVMLDENGYIRLLDFGLARARIENGPAVTMTGQVAGTLRYLAPEMLTAGTEPDPRQDVYALGVMLYELLTEKAPYEVPDASPASLSRITSGKFPAPRELRPDLSPSLNALVMKGLARNPANRLARAGDFVRELDRFEIPGATKISPVNGPGAKLPVILLLLGVGVALLAVGIWMTTPDGVEENTAPDEVPVVQPVLAPAGALGVVNRQPVGQQDWALLKKARTAMDHWSHPGTPGFLVLTPRFSGGTLRVVDSQGNHLQSGCFEGQPVEMVLAGGTWTLEITSVDGKHWRGEVAVQAGEMSQADLLREAPAAPVTENGRDS